METIIWNTPEQGRLRLPDGVGVATGSGTVCAHGFLNFHFREANNLSDGPYGVDLHFEIGPPAKFAQAAYLNIHPFTLQPSSKLWRVSHRWRYAGQPVTGFAYKFHTHYRGVWVEVLLARPRASTRIYDSAQVLFGGSPSSQEWMYFDAKIRTNDELELRCYYNVSGLSHSIRYSGSVVGEMCMIYLQYHTDQLVSYRIWDNFTEQSLNGTKYKILSESVDVHPNLMGTLPPGYRMPSRNFPQESPTLEFKTRAMRAALACFALILCCVASCVSLICVFSRFKGYKRVTVSDKGLNNLDVDKVPSVRIGASVFL